MQTRAKSGIVKPNPKYAFHTKLTSVKEPGSVREASQHSGWLQAMKEELQALADNNTWILVPRQQDMHVIGIKWVYKVKYKANGSDESLKARLVAKGFAQ